METKDPAIEALLVKVTAGLEPWSKANYRTVVETYRGVGIEEDSTLPSADGHIPVKGYAVAIANILTLAAGQDISRLNNKSMQIYAEQASTIAWQEKEGGRVWELALLLRPDSFVEAIDLPESLRALWLANAGWLVK